MEQPLTAEKALRQARKISVFYCAFWAALTTLMIWGNGGETDFEIEAFTGTFAVTGLIIFIMTFFKNKSRRKKSAAPESEVIARWAYSQEEWQRFTSAEAGFEKSEATGIGWAAFVVFFLLVVGTWLFEDNKSWQTFIEFVIGGMIAGATLGWLVWMWYKVFALLRFVRYSEHIEQPEALIMKESIRIGNDEYRWNRKAGSYKLLGVLKNEQHEHPVLEFALHATNDRRDVRVPIPQGKVEEADNVIELLHPKGSRF